MAESETKENARLTESLLSRGSWIPKGISWK